MRTLFVVALVCVAAVSAGCSNACAPCEPNPCCEPVYVSPCCPAPSQGLGYGPSMTPAPAAPMAPGAAGSCGGAGASCG
jgi:hypothetical protein